jgi:hypothetical protein
VARKSSGKDFLFSDDCGFINGDDEGGESHRYSDGSGYYHGADGSEGHIYSDGSGYYHGADGSDGYIYSDGSAYFRGADGTDAYKYSDGSGYYRGADGSDGYKYSNGSGYFTDSAGSRTSYDMSYDENSINSSLGELFGTIIGAGLVGLMEAGSKVAIEEQAREAQREAERREKARINSENRRAWRKKHKKGIFITILISIIVLLLLIGYYEIQKLIPMVYSSDSLEGLKYTEAVQRLKESGFSNVHTKEISDLTISRDDEENVVTEVKLLFGDSFDEDTKYPSNLWITVVYHTVELYTPPLTSKEVKDMNHLDVIDEFENAGFINVTTVVEYDIVTGWLADDGEVKSVTINGEKKFDSDDEYRLDAEVVVTYHALKKNKSE